MAGQTTGRCKEPLLPPSPSPGQVVPRFKGLVEIGSFPKHHVMAESPQSVPCGYIIEMLGSCPMSAMRLSRFAPLSPSPFYFSFSPPPRPHRLSLPGPSATKRADLKTG